MKGKRAAHARIIENFQEKSQQAEVIRHDMIGMHEVCMSKHCIMD